MLMRCTTVVALFTLIAACDGGKAAVHEDFSDLATMDQKSDAFSYRLKLLGPIAPGAPRNLLYTSTPRFRAFELKASAGDALDVWVRGPRGDALTWLLDSSFHVIDSNDDANA